MKQTVVGIFDYGVDAQMAAQDLMKSGIPTNNIDVAVRGANDRTQGNITNQQSTSTSSTSATHRTDTTSKDESFFGSLFDNKDESRKYAEVAKHGAIVTVHTDSKEQAEKAAKVLDKCGAIDVNERAEQFRSMSGGQRTGWTTSNRDTSDKNRTTTDRTITDKDRNSTEPFPIMEEKLNVGKREVENGGITMRSRIIEKPVEEHLRLREEHVNVERNKVDRPASEKDLSAFQEGSARIVERAEVPVVNKEARVVEEVRLKRETSSHDETIRENVKKQEVDADKLKTDRDNLNRTDSNDPTKRNI